LFVNGFSFHEVSLGDVVAAEHREVTDGVGDGAEDLHAVRGEVSRHGKRRS
jgi:hypothetical protein